MAETLALVQSSRSGLDYYYLKQSMTTGTGEQARVILPKDVERVTVMVEGGSTDSIELKISFALDSSDVYTLQSEIADEFIPVTLDADARCIFINVTTNNSSSISLILFANKKKLTNPKAAA